MLQSSADSYAEDQHHDGAQSVQAGQERDTASEPKRFVPLTSLLHFGHKSGPQREVVEQAQHENHRHQDQLGDQDRRKPEV